MPGLQARRWNGAVSTDNSDLDRFFRQFAGQDQFRHHVGVTYLAVDDQHILGFATVAAAHVEIDGLPHAARRIEASAAKPAA